MYAAPRKRRRYASARIGPRRKIEFDGLIAIATPAASPAASASIESVRSRTRKLK